MDQSRTDAKPLTSEINDGAKGAQFRFYIAQAGKMLTHVCHQLAAEAGWWGSAWKEDPRHMPVDHSFVDYLKSRELHEEAAEYIRKTKATPNPLLFSNKLALIHSEVSEAMEGDRKSLKDDKLPQYDMRAVELADAAIRCFDTAGAYGYDLGEIIAAKLAYNAVRKDHKPEQRALTGGKAY